MAVIDNQGMLAAASKTPLVFASFSDHEYFTVHQAVDSGPLFISKPAVGLVAGIIK